MVATAYPKKISGYTVLYSQKSLLDKNFCTQPSYPYIKEIISEIPCGKPHHRLYVIFSIGQKISPMRAGREKGENILQVKISSYRVYTLTIMVL